MSVVVPHGCIFLNPGEYFWGGEENRVRTILGSCVAITLWHPQRKTGGMCHYLLPFSLAGKDHDNPRYADGAMTVLMDRIQRSGTRVADYQVKMFGGGNMFSPHITNVRPIGLRNIEAGERLLERYGFTLTASDVGGFGYRTVVFDIRSGDVWVRRQRATDPENPVAETVPYAGTH